jgi:hypothetical protein
MKNIKISIEGEVLDLPEEINSFKLTFALKDNSGVAVNTGTRSEYSFNFPATKTNDTIFKRFWNVGELNSDVQISYNRSRWYSLFSRKSTINSGYS